MDNDHCLWTKKGLHCFNDGGGNAFKESREIFVKAIEKMDKDSPYRIVKKCKTQGLECFNRNIRNAGIFFFMILLSGMLLNFLHEIVHYAFFFMIGIHDVSFTFATNAGFIAGSIPAFGDPAIPWYWWYLETMGPTVMVNFPVVLVSMSIINHDVKNPPFLDERMSIGFNASRTTFLKSMAYTSAFSILTNTIFSPFYNMLYMIIGLPSKKSDFSVAWEASLYIPEPYGTITRIAIIATVGIIILVTIMYIFLYNRRETGE